MKTKVAKIIGKFCQEISQLSNCKRAKQACVLSSLDGESILAYGYNGDYRGGPNTCTGPNEPGKCECIHAELNALIKTRLGQEFVVFITQSPCLPCAKLLINSRCRYVYFMLRYRDESGIILLKNNNIGIEELTL